MFANIFGLQTEVFLHVHNYIIQIRSCIVQKQYIFANKNTYFC